MDVSSDTADRSLAVTPTPEEIIYVRSTNPTPEPAEVDAVESEDLAENDITEENDDGRGGKPDAPLATFSVDDDCSDPEASPSRSAHSARSTVAMMPKLPSINPGSRVGTASTHSGDDASNCPLIVHEDKYTVTSETGGQNFGRPSTPGDAGESQNGIELYTVNTTELPICEVEGPPEYEEVETNLMEPENLSWTINEEQDDEDDPEVQNRGIWPILCQEMSFEGARGTYHMIPKVTPILAAICTILSLIFSCFHTVDEGNVGIYYRFGALTTDIREPGLHFKNLFFEEFFEVTIRPETTNLPYLTAISRDGIKVTFEDMQVITEVNLTEVHALVKKFGRDFKDPLVFDRIREETLTIIEMIEIRQKLLKVSSFFYEERLKIKMIKKDFLKVRIFVANNTMDDVFGRKSLGLAEGVEKEVARSIERLGGNGLKVLKVVINKPSVPRGIARNYQKVKIEWTNQLIQKQKKKTEEIRLQTKKILEVSDARRKLSVLEVDIAKLLLEGMGNKTINSIENDILMEKANMNADVSFYKRKMKSIANKELLSPAYTEVQLARHMEKHCELNYLSGGSSEWSSVMGSPGSLALMLMSSVPEQSPVTPQALTCPADKCRAGRSISYTGLQNISTILNV